MRMALRATIASSLAITIIGVIYVGSSSGVGTLGTPPPPTCEVNGCNSNTPVPTPVTAPFNQPGYGQIQTGSLPALVTHVDRNGNLVVDGNGVPILYPNPLRRDPNLSGTGNYPNSDPGPYSAR